MLGFQNIFGTYWNLSFPEIIRIYVINIKSRSWPCIYYQSLFGLIWSQFACCTCSSKWSTVPKMKSLNCAHLRYFHHDLIRNLPYGTITSFSFRQIRIVILLLGRYTCLLSTIVIFPTIWWCHRYLFSLYSLLWINVC